MDVHDVFECPRTCGRCEDGNPLTMCHRARNETGSVSRHESGPNPTLNAVFRRVATQFPEYGPRVIGVPDDEYTNTANLVVVDNLIPQDIVADILSEHNCLGGYENSGTVGNDVNASIRLSQTCWCTGAFDVVTLNKDLI